MKKGFTLVEALVVVAIFSILFGLVFEILATGRRTGETGFTQQEIQNQAKQGLENMTLELYESSRTKVVPSPPFSDSAEISFQVPVGYDGVGNLLWGAEGNTGYWINYSVDSNTHQLVRTVRNNQGETVEMRVLANFVESVSFSLTESQLTISLTTRKSGLGVPELSLVLTSAVTFRN